MNDEQTEQGSGGRRGQSGLQVMCKPARAVCNIKKEEKCK